MTCYEILPHDLAREISRYLHKSYYDVVLIELKEMTRLVPNCFDNYHLLIHTAGERHTLSLIPYTIIVNDYCICIPRWAFWPVPSTYVFLSKKHFEGKMSSMP